MGNGTGNPLPGGRPCCSAWTCGVVERVELAAGTAPPERGGCRGGVWSTGPGMMNHERPGPVAMVTQCENKLYTHIYTSVSVLIHARKHAKPNALFFRGEATKSKCLDGRPGLGRRPGPGSGCPRTLPGGLGGGLWAGRGRGRGRGGRGTGSSPLSQA